MHIGIVGGGIIGLSCAWYALRSGHTVTLFDAAPEAREASWAAAGMLAPYNEAQPADAAFDLMRAGLRAWQPFLRDMAVGDDEVDYRGRGCLIPIIDNEDRSHTDDLRRKLQQAGVGHTVVHGSELRRAEPAHESRSAGTRSR